MDSHPKTGGEAKTVGYVLRELGSSATELIRNEVSLIKSEIKFTGDRLIQHGSRLALSGLLLALSLIPFLAFIIIALGRWLDGRYWLSSLIVAIVCAGTGAIIADRSWKQLKEDDLTLEKSRGSIEAGRETLKEKAKDIQNAVKGEFYEHA